VEFHPVGLEGPSATNALIEFTAAYSLSSCTAQCRTNVECAVEARELAQHLHACPLIFQKLQARSCQTILSGFPDPEYCCRDACFHKNHQFYAILGRAPFFQCESALVVTLSRFLTGSSLDRLPSSPKFSVMLSGTACFSTFCFFSCPALVPADVVLFCPAQRIRQAQILNFSRHFSPAYCTLPSQWPFSIWVSAGPGPQCRPDKRKSSRLTALGIGRPPAFPCCHCWGWGGVFTGPRN